MPGNEDDRELNVRLREFSLKIKAALPRQSDVEHQAGGSLWTARFEEVAHRAEQFHFKSDRSQEPPERLPDPFIVIDNDDCF